MNEKSQQDKKYFCKICNNVLKIKNELLFCETCNIFIGKLETYQKSFDHAVLKNNAIHKVDQNRNDGDFSVMISIYLFFVFVIGVGMISYIGFSSGFLLGKIICQNLQCM